MNNYKIYIVEDMGVTRAALSSILTRNGHTIVGSSATAEKAWLEIEGLQPEIILLDFNLKGTKTGLWLAEKIKNNFDIPIIFLTAYGSNEFLEKITKIGADGYIMKPVNNSTLLANIQLAVANFKAKQTSLDKDKTTNLHYMLKTKNGFYKIKIENILYLKSDGNYVTVFLEAEQYTCRNKLKDLIAEFNNTQIRKTHRRFAINLSKVTKITKKTVFINNIEIPVSNTHIADIENLLGT